MTSAVVLLALLAAASAASLRGSGGADKDLITQQRDILSLFEKIQQPVLIPEHVELMKTFKWESIKDKFKDSNTVERFMYLYEHHEFLPRDKDFSMSYFRHLFQMMKIFDVLLSATDFDTFYKTAVWMRYHLNQRMFTYALNAALFMREDTNFMMVPPLYEVFPEYYVTSDVIQRAYEGHLRGLDTKEDDPYIIWANYTGLLKTHGAETSLSYFREDVGLASYWALFGMKHALWMNSTDSMPPFMKYRGLIFYYVVRNLLGRYDMERYSNGLDRVLPVEMWDAVEGYDPKLRHQSGLDFPARPEGLKVKSTDELSLEDVIDWERRMRDGVAMAIYLDEKVQVKQLTPENAMNVIGYEIMGGGGSPNTNYYGSILYGLFTLFGHMMDPRHQLAMAPSALQIPDTMPRDPLFYRILKRMWTIMDNYKKNLPPYTKDEMSVPGLKIESMKIEKLITFFDNFDIHVDNAVDVQKIEDAGKVNVIARQHRLNHKPFSYTVKVTSDKPMDAMVRVFLGPHADWDVDRWTQDVVRHQFYLLDAFPYTMKAGENTIIRNSREMCGMGDDSLSFRQMYDKVEAALAGKEKLVVGEDQMRYRKFPYNLLLPKGSRNGLPVTLLTVVSDVRDAATWPGACFSDHRDAFFPLDRHVFLWELRAMPNAHFQDVSIFHRRNEDLNAPE